MAAGGRHRRGKLQAKALCGLQQAPSHCYTQVSQPHVPGCIVWNRTFSTSGQFAAANSAESTAWPLCSRALVRSCSPYGSQHVKGRQELQADCSGTAGRTFCWAR